MKLDWQVFAALVASFTGMAALAIFLINAVVEKRLSVFLKDLNGTYLRTALAGERFSSMEQSITLRFSDMERRLAELHSYTHEWRQELNNELLKLRGIT